MKTKRLVPAFVMGATCAAGVLLPARSHAQAGGPFELSWSTVSGGSASGGGRFQLGGTAGQPEAGSLSGGRFELQGGFWSGITLLQTPGAPTLKIRHLGNGLAVVSWPIHATGFSLEECVALGSGLWTPTPQSVLDTATDHTVTVPAAATMKCYRLRK